MRKRLTTLMLTLLLVLTACTPGRTTPPPFELSLAQRLLGSGAFSEPLDTLDADLAWLLFGLEDAGLTRDQLSRCACYRSSGATCEEVAVLHFTDEEAARTSLNALKSYIAAQAESNKDYRPAELPKLNAALLERRGSTVLLLVANDPTLAAALIH